MSTHLLPLVLRVTDDGDDLTCILCGTPRFEPEGRSSHPRCEYSVRFLNAGGSAQLGLHKRCYDRAQQETP